MSQNNTDTDNSNWTTVTSRKPKQQKVDVVEQKPTFAKKKSKVTEDNSDSVEKVAKPVHVKKELEPKVDTEWDLAFRQVYTSYLEYIKNRHPISEIKDKISGAMYVIDKRTGAPTNHVFLDVRKWSGTKKEDRKQVEVEEVNGYKFVLNRFFDDRNFVRDLKNHFRTYGFSIGFQKRKNQNHFDYLGMKCYFRDN
jgi:hypothetical protein